MLRRIRFGLFVLLASILATAGTLLPRNQSLAASTISIYLPMVANGYSVIPNDLFVKSSSAFKVGTDLMIVGELMNNTSTNLRNIRISATLFDAASQPITTTVGIAPYANVLSVGKLSPFAITIPNAPAFSRYELTLAKPLTTTDTELILPMSGVSAGWNKTNDVYRIIGQATNNGTANLSPVEALVTLYDASGKVIGVGKSKTPASQVVAPGQSWAFSVEISSWNGMPDTTVVSSYALEVFAVVAGP